MNTKAKLASGLWRCVETLAKPENIVPRTIDNTEWAIVDGNNRSVLNGPHQAANAAFIVRAVNSHDDLVEALSLAETAMNRSASTGAVYLSELKELLPKIRAALAKATATD